MINDEATRAADFKVLQISSDVIAENGSIPMKFTARGENINPPFNVQHIPQDAKTLAVVIINDNSLVHWLSWNIPLTHHIRENELHGTAGTNSFGNQRYDGPQNAG